MVFQNLASVFEDLRFKVIFNEDSNATFETPLFKSFNITGQRGTIVGTASLTLKVTANQLAAINASDSNSSGGSFNNKSAVVIQGKLGSNTWKTLFTGMIKSITIKHDLLFANNYIVDIQASDSMDILQDRTYTRRVKENSAAEMSVFAVINGITRKAGLGRNQSTSNRGRRASGRFNPTGVSALAFRASDVADEATTQSLEVTLSLAELPTYKSANHPRVVDNGRFKRDTSGTNSGSSGTANVIKIFPQFVVLAPDEEQAFCCDDNCTATETESGDAYTWSVRDQSLGTLLGASGGTPVPSINTDDPTCGGGEIYYKHLVAGNVINEVVLTRNVGTTSVGYATVVGLPIHNQASMGSGGPAYGVYAPITDEP